MIFFLLGSSANISAILWNWRLIGSPPFGTMYHVMLFLGACFLPVYLITVLHNKTERASFYFPIIASLPIIFALFLFKGETWRQPPVLQSVWFIPHVTSYMLAYSLAIIAFLLNSHRLLVIAFPLMTFGLFSGAIWADGAWASYWSWSEPKETFALITWVLYLTYFHFSKSARLQKFTRIVHAFAFLSLIATFLLVNLLPKLSSSLHSYK